MTAAPASTVAWPPRLSGLPLPLAFRRARFPDIEGAVSSVRDALEDPLDWCDLLVERAAQAARGDLPDAQLFLKDYDGALGWAAWVPYLDAADGQNVWHTSTYLAVRARGTGMLKAARCLQVHAMERVAAWSAERELPAPRFVSSIGTWNGRSVAASSKYAREHAWGVDLVEVTETVKGREAFLLWWPESPAHTCLLAG